MSERAQSEPRLTRADADETRDHPGWLRGVIKVDRLLGNCEHAGLAALLAILLVVAVYSAVASNFNAKPSWADEAIRTSVFFIALLGGALAAQSDQLIRMDVLTRVLSPRMRAITRVLTGLFTIGICAMFAYVGLHIREVALAVEQSTNEILSVTTVALAVPICAWLIAAHLALHAIVTLWQLTHDRLPTQEGTPLH